MDTADCADVWVVQDTLISVKYFISHKFASIFTFCVFNSNFIIQHPQRFYQRNVHNILQMYRQFVSFKESHRLQIQSCLIGFISATIIQMESIFECGVCFKQYNHTEKKPLSLPCGHTFCLECLRQINKLYNFFSNFIIFLCKFSQNLQYGALIIGLQLLNINFYLSNLYYKHSVIKCPFDKIAHHTSADNLPVNYAVLTALPITQMASNTTSGTPGATKEGGGIQYCDTHKNKKVKFFCKSDQEMFCSKCVLKHTNAKHEEEQNLELNLRTIKCEYRVSMSYKILEMKRMVKDMLEEVDSIDRNNNQCIYTGHT